MQASVLGCRITTASYEEVVEMIIQWAAQNECRSVFAANVHMIMTAYDSPAFRNVVNLANIVTPDGMPLVWALRWQGYRTQERVYGPTLMQKVLEDAARKGIPVGFFGTTNEVLKELSEKFTSLYPGLQVALQIAPPFHTLSEDEDQQLIQQINNSGVKILFVGLGCPKQEMWISEHYGKIQAIMIGVGAAFNFHAGTIRQAPGWMQKNGLEWLFRLFQEPGRLWKRYLWNNPRFIILLLCDRIGKLFKR